MSYSEHVNHRIDEVKQIIDGVNDLRQKSAADFRAQVVELGLSGKNLDEIKESANDELDILQKYRLSILALGVGAELDESPGRGGDKVALGYVRHGENSMHLASFDHMKSVAEASSQDIDAVDVLDLTTAHEEDHIRLHSHREALAQVIVGVKGDSEAAHDVEEGVVSIHSGSYVIDAYQKERDLVDRVAQKIHLSRTRFIHLYMAGEVGEIQQAANGAGYFGQKQTG